MSQRRPRPRPGHALKKLASPHLRPFQSVDGGSRVCGGSLRPNRRTPPRKGRAPKPSARDAPLAVCDPIDTHSSHVCAAADRRCARTPSGDMSQPTQALAAGGVSCWVGFGGGWFFVRRGWAVMGRCREEPRARVGPGSSPGHAMSFSVAPDLIRGLRASQPGFSVGDRPPTRRSCAPSTSPRGGGEEWRTAHPHTARHLPLVGRSAGPWGCRVGGKRNGRRRAGGCSTTPPRCRWFQDVTRLGGRPRGRRGSPWGRWAGDRSLSCLRAGRFQATPSRHAVRRSCAPK